MNLHRRLAPFLLAPLAICTPFRTAHAHADDGIPAKTGTSTAPLVAPASPAPTTPEAPAAPTPTPASESQAAAATPAASAPPAEPFAFADFSWMPGNAGDPDRPLKAGPFTGEVRVDAAYHYSFNHPKDNTISGSSEVFRHNELQLTQLGLGGDFLYKNVQARVMTQFGMYSQTTPRNDASPSRGQWGLDNAYRYISEAYGGYHIDALHGINVQAGIFMSYIGLWSYYNADNWTYQPSYVSSNTPWFFNGARAQIFASAKLKIEPWLVNGWQSYGKFNQAPGGGVQIAYRPTGSLAFVSNNYVGSDTLGTAGRVRFHTDNSVMAKWHDDPNAFVSKLASSLTVDVGCEDGGGVSCNSQYFLGFMAYTRAWFLKNRFGATVGGGAITNPGRYLVLIPPVNGATAASGTPCSSATTANSSPAIATRPGTSKRPSTISPMVTSPSAPSSIIGRPTSPTSPAPVVSPRRAETKGRPVAPSVGGLQTSARARIA